MNTLDHQRRLMKFANHELTPEEEASLLLEAEREPARWRGLALSLVEERRIAQALGTAAAGPAGSARRPQRWRLAAAACLGGLISTALLYAARGPALIPPPVAEQIPTAQPPVNPTGARPQPATTPAPFPGNPHTVMRPWFSDQQHAQAHEHGFTLEEQPLVVVVRRNGGKPQVTPHRRLRLIRHAP